VLRFQSRPDGVFLAILHDALEFLIDQVSSVVDESRDEPSTWADIYPDLATFFSPQLARDTLSKLLEASKAPRLYQLTDYHWYLVHVALQLLIDVHNDDLRDEPSRLIRVGQYKIGPIDLDAILDRFFWDLDFEGPNYLLSMSPEERRQGTFSDEAWSIAAHLKPHPDELTLDVWTGDPDWEVDTGTYPECGIIATYPRDLDPDDPTG
jgi:hypothetical protein